MAHCPQTCSSNYLSMFCMDWTAAGLNDSLVSSGSSLGDMMLPLPGEDEDQEEGAASKQRTGSTENQNSAIEVGVTVGCDAM